MLTKDDVDLDTVLDVAQWVYLTLASQVSADPEVVTPDSFRETLEAAGGLEVMDRPPCHWMYDGLTKQLYALLDLRQSTDTDCTRT